MGDQRGDKEQLLDRILEISEELYLKMSREGTAGASDHFNLFNIFAELGRSLVASDRASFWKWDRRARKLITTAQVGTSRIEIDEGTGLVGRALREGHAIVTNDPYHHPDFNSSVDKKTGYTTRSILVMPVCNCRGEIIGAYQAINALDEERGFVLEEDCRRLSLAALICGLTLESDLFLSDSQTDKLTGLKNRMGFHSDYLAKHSPAMQVPDNQVSLIICDIDFFKKVNDTYGHNAGDAVLAKVAEVLSGSVRGSDEVYRWGGEEFIAILPGADVEQAAQAAERIRRRIEGTVTPFEDLEIHVTMSFGVVQMDPEKTAEENIQVADGRLYRAKEGGRNRVVSKDL